MSRFLLFCIAIVIITFFGCSDKNSISKDKAKNILNNYFAKNCIILPMEQEESFRLYRDNEKTLHVKKEYKKYNFFKNYGYYISKKILDKNQSNFTSETYKLSQTGKKIFRFKKHRLFIEKGFCVGNYRVKNIQEFLEAKNVFNHKAVEVEFEAEIINMPNFTKNSQFRDIFPDFSKLEIYPNKIVLFQTNGSWSVKKEVR